MLFHSILFSDKVLTDNRRGCEELVKQQEVILR